MNFLDDDKVVIDEILIPLEYDDVDFRFNNLGTFANTVGKNHALKKYDQFT